MVLQLRRNKEGGFTNVPLAGVTPIYSGAVAWADYDNDGKLDFLVTGPISSSPAGAITQLWRNRTPTANTPPSVPFGLTATTSFQGVAFSWNAPTDGQSPASGLSYNLRVGTAPESGDAVNPESGSNGIRRLPGLGNAQMRTNAFLNLPPGTYYWSVQAVDSEWSGGPFAAEQSFTVPARPELSITRSGSNVILSWPPSPGWILQEKPTLRTPTWTNAPSGSANPVTLSATNSTMFYRLLKPRGFVNKRWLRPTT